MYFYHDFFFSRAAADKKNTDLYNDFFFSGVAAKNKT